MPCRTCSRRRRIWPLPILPRPGWADGLRPRPIAAGGSSPLPVAKGMPSARRVRRRRREAVPGRARRGAVARRLHAFRVGAAPGRAAPSSDPVEVARTTREGSMYRTFSLLAGAGLGAGLMYFLDPRSGRRRRAVTADKATRLCTRPAARSTWPAGTRPTGPADCGRPPGRPPSRARPPTTGSWPSGCGPGWGGSSPTHTPFGYRPPGGQ